MSPEIAVPREILLNLARLLERWVVSEDRIGSWYAEGSLDDCDREAGRWYRESGLVRETASRRADVFTLLGHYDPVDDDELERVESEFERELGKIAYWTRPGD
ncbi:hypothetical protein [Dactylosporangium darangshiense]|uniref:Uncharacterized protein n=1 Tax=Dactylosporangium darangshiense TaxID=579108 RepID=A0ABP8DV48_9ACTN